MVTLIMVKTRGTVYQTSEEKSTDQDQGGFSELTLETFMHIDPYSEQINVPRRSQTDPCASTIFTLFINHQS